jgi:threonine dehydrogenase-like Zn-dependent dehydrogenase
MAEKILAAVKVGVWQSEVREFDTPDIPPDAGLLKMEAAGVCGADVKSHRGQKEPLILGHENVGVIARLGSIAAKNWGVKEGDRVALEEYIPCGHCRLCRSGDFRLCEQTETRTNKAGAYRYGSMPITMEPSLWGGYSQYLYMHPDSVIHSVPAHVPGNHAALFIPLSNGIQWAHFEAGASIGKSLLIQGPGQMGLSCLIAAKEAGASEVIISGLGKDAKRLETARVFGADHVIDVDSAGLVERVLDLTQGQGVDAVIDTAGGPGTFENALKCVKKGGIFCVGTSSVSVDFKPNDLLVKRLTLKGMRGHSYEAVELALRTIASGKYNLDLLATHTFSLDQVDLAIKSIAGEGVPGAVHVSVLPWQ